MKKAFVMGATLATLALGACSGTYFGNTPRTTNTNAQSLATMRAIRDNGDFWQRTDNVSAQYLTGPKAQHQLNMDIATCVSEVRELVRLGSIHSASAPKGIGMDQGLRSGWTGATRNGPKYTEYTEFQDFDGCMDTKGWARAKFVDPSIADNAAFNYNRTILGATSHTRRTTNQDEFSLENTSFNN